MSSEYRVTNDVEFIIPMSELLDRDKRTKTIRLTTLDKLIRYEFGGSILVEEIPALLEKLGFYVTE